MPPASIVINDKDRRGIGTLKMIEIIISCHLWIYAAFVMVISLVCSLVSTLSIQGPQLIQASFQNGYWGHATRILILHRYWEKRLLLFRKWSKSKLCQNSINVIKQEGWLIENLYSCEKGYQHSFYMNIRCHPL